MALTPEDERAAMLTQLNGFFSIVEQMSAVDTSGIEPLYTPLSAVQEVHLRLRDDAVSETSAPAQRELNQRSAPVVEDGLYLVPKVIAG
jgi:aspartyl-tRNA(Asn)/glutamyl-tRNA(Gln) amidotransferase subunit C